MKFLNLCLLGLLAFSFINTAHGMIITGQSTDMDGNKSFTLAETWDHNDPDLRQNNPLIVEIIEGELPHAFKRDGCIVNETDSSLELMPEIKCLQDAEKQNKQWITHLNKKNYLVGDCKALGIFKIQESQGSEIFFKRLVHAITPNGSSPEYATELATTYENLFKETRYGAHTNKIALPILGIAHNGDINTSIKIAIKTLLNYRLNNPMFYSKIVFVIPKNTPHNASHCMNLFEQELMQYNNSDFAKQHLSLPVNNTPQQQDPSLLKSKVFWARVLGISAVVAVFAAATYAVYRKYKHYKKVKKSNN